MADTKQQWYKDAKYGLFIHWGLYSILAGEWKDPKTGEVTKTDRIAEWIENNLNIDKEDYRKLKDEFHPDKFDADMFVKRAKEQWGVKYIVLTSKHHEGFAMYDSKVSDFNVVKAAGRDILRELSDERTSIQAACFFVSAYSPVRSEHKDHASGSYPQIIPDKQDGPA